MATVFALCVYLKAKIRHQWVKASVHLCLSMHRSVLVPVCVCHYVRRDRPGIVRDYRAGGTVNSMVNV